MPHHCPRCGRPEGPPPPHHGQHGCCNHGSKFSDGILFGALIGVALGLLYAPTAGKETREKLKKETDKLKEKAEPVIQDAKDKVGPMLAQAQEKAGPIIDRVKEKVVETLDDLDEMNRKRVKDKDKKSFFRGIN